MVHHGRLRVPEAACAVDVAWFRGEVEPVLLRQCLRIRSCVRVERLREQPSSVSDTQGQAPVRAYCRWQPHQQTVLAGDAQQGEATELVGFETADRERLCQLY